MGRKAQNKLKSVVVVTTTVARAAEAKHMAARIVESRLAACVQTLPIRSLYRWKGKVESAGEILLFIKTRSDLEKRVVALIRELHTYEVPEILVMPVKGGLPAYIEWIWQETE